MYPNITTMMFPKTVHLSKKRYRFRQQWADVVTHLSHNKNLPDEGCPRRTENSAHYFFHRHCCFSMNVAESRQNSNTHRHYAGQDLTLTTCSTLQICPYRVCPSKTFVELQTKQFKREDVYAGQQHIQKLLQYVELQCRVPGRWAAVQYVNKTLASFILLVIHFKLFHCNGVVSWFD